MSIPAVNVYTHGTHITVAHAMGTTIGINSMILFASIFYIFSKTDNFFLQQNKSKITFALWGGNISLLVFWIALIIAGIIKGYYMVSQNVNFETTMLHVRPLLWIFAFAGILVATSLIYLSVVLLKAMNK